MASRFQAKQRSEGDIYLLNPSSRGSGLSSFIPLGLFYPPSCWGLYSCLGGYRSSISIKVKTWQISHSAISQDMAWLDWRLAEKKQIVW